MVAKWNTVDTLNVRRKLSIDGAWMGRISKCAARIGQDWRLSRTVLGLPSRSVVGVRDAAGHIPRRPFIQRPTFISGALALFTWRRARNTDSHTPKLISPALNRWCDLLDQPIGMWESADAMIRFSHNQPNNCLLNYETFMRRTVFPRNTWTC